jgi:hypothetical protein
MAIQRRITNVFTRKADQQWDMAGLARQDGDHAAEAEHTRQARDFERQALDFERAKAPTTTREEDRPPFTSTQAADEPPEADFYGE